MNKADADRAIGPGVPVTFSISVNETKVTKVLKVSTSHKSIIGGVSPNHFFDISDLPKDDVNTIITGTSVSVKITKATEAKVSFMSFQ